MMEFVNHDIIIEIRRGDLGQSKICTVLDCDISDLLEFVPPEK